MTTRANIDWEKATATENGFAYNDITFILDWTKTVNQGTSQKGLWNDYRSKDKRFFIRAYKKDVLKGNPELATHLFN